MKAALRTPPVDVPTLTEVVGPAELAVPVALVAQGEHMRDGDDALLADRILRDLQGQVDQLLLSTLRERLAPLFEQVAAGLVEEVAPILHEAVRQAVARELARERGRSV